MNKDVGDKTFPIWLLGDSNPRNWQDDLDAPLDPRHPARHNIWTSVLNVMQDKVFREQRVRIDTSSLYIRNAIEDPADKPARNSKVWHKKVEHEVDTFRQSVNEFEPLFIISFGAFSFEFARRALSTKLDYPYGYWTTKKLGEAFRQHLNQFQMKTTIIPLLHTSIARGRFVQSHKHFCNNENGNYFVHSGTLLAQTMLENADQLDIWIA